MKIAEAKSRRVELHDFRRPELIDRQRLSVLGGVLESFARHATVELSTLLRSSCQVALDGVEQRSWAEVVAGLPAQVDLVSFGLPPLPGLGVLALGRQTVMAVVDLRMGGTGEVAGLDREITEVDQALLAPILDGFLGELPRSLGKLMAVRVRVAAQETNAQFVQIAAPRETCIAASFTLNLAGVLADVLTMVMPAAGLGPLLEALRLGGPGLAERDSPCVDPAVVGEVPVELRLRFAPVSIPSRDLLALEPGVVLALGHPVQDPLELAIGDVVVGSAELGATGRRCVARITRMEKKE